MATVVKNTNIADLLEVSRGNSQVLEKMTKEFRELVQTQYKKQAPARVEKAGADQ